MLRHSVLWTLRDTTTAEQQREMLHVLAHLRTECLSVRTGDYGQDLFGGSTPLRTVKPQQRTPVWKRDGLGPASNFDMALHLDFDDWARFREYAADPTHGAASTFNESVSWDELTARVDWYFDVPTLCRRGHVKHVVMFVWKDGLDDAEKAAALGAVQALAGAPGVGAVTVGHNAGQGTTDYDWILDVELPDRATAERLLGGAAYAAAMEAVAARTKFEWTARLTHLMRGRA
jgi:hypothetical protein